MTKKLCPDLAPRIQAPLPNDSNATLLSVVLPATAVGTPTTVARYKVRFALREPSGSPFVFDLTATGTSAGFPRYLATFEGAIHRTTAFRDATTSDPIVPGAAR
jgi:hypothetical protein